MKITGNVYNQPYNANKIGFKGREDVKYLVSILNRIPMRVDELAENGIFRKITKEELESKEVLDAFEKAKEKQLLDGGRRVINSAYKILMRPFKKANH